MIAGFGIRFAIMKSSSSAKKPSAPVSFFRHSPERNAVYRKIPAPSQPSITSGGKQAPKMRFRFSSISAPQSPQPPRKGFRVVFQRNPEQYGKQDSADGSAEQKKQKRPTGFTAFFRVQPQAAQ